MAGTSQLAVARAARISRSTISRIEGARLQGLSLADAVRVADAVGLNLSVKAFPGAPPTRDAAHAARLSEFLSHVSEPLRFALEVPLPPRESAPEQRAWDAMLHSEDGDVGIELEQRLYDMQAQTRRLMLKWRDSGVERLMLVIADSPANRRTARLFPEYLAELPALRKQTVIAMLEAGQRPPTGHVFF